MLLAVVHANGTYHAHKGENEPIITEDELWSPENGYWKSLARVMIRHLDGGNPVLYLPQWNNSHLTDIFTNPAKKQAALDADPLLQMLGSAVNEVVIRPTATGSNAMTFGHDSLTENLWRDTLLQLSKEEKVAYFVGAYTSSSVSSIALLVSKVAEAYIDPALSVDIRGEGVVRNDPCILHAPLPQIKGTDLSGIV